MNKRNYQREMDILLEKLKSEGKTPTILLHSCCAPCSSYCLEYLTEYFNIAVFFYNPNMIDPKEPNVQEISRACDQYNIPIATNIATAEMLILGLGRGDLDWRMMR